MVAEDNVVNRRLLTRLLEKRGHQVTIAASGRAAVDTTGGECFDSILMDVQMPEMDGFGATKAIRDRDHTLKMHTPIVALTAHAILSGQFKTGQRNWLGLGCSNLPTLLQASLFLCANSVDRTSARGRDAMSGHREAVSRWARMAMSVSLSRLPNS